MRNVVQLCLASNNILLVRKWKHAFLRSLLRENGTLGFPKIFIQKQARWLNEKTIIALSYRKISWFVSVSLINYLPQPSASVNNWPTRYRQITIFCSISSNRLLMSVQTQDVLNVAEAFIALLSFSVIDVKTSYNRIKRKIAAFAITVACEQALLFGRAKRVAREGASPLACLSRVDFSRYPPNGELARRLQSLQQQQQQQQKHERPCICSRFAPPANNAVRSWTPQPKEI